MLTERWALRVWAEVNAGPSAICKAFLGEPDRYPADKVDACRRAFRRFLSICDEGLKLNAAHIGTVIQVGMGGG